MNVNKREWILGLVVALPLALNLCAQTDRLPANGPQKLEPGQLPPMLQSVGVEEHLGRNVDLGLKFIAEDGSTVALGDFFHKGKPVVLDLIYYSCPNLCNLILNGQAEVMRQIPWNPGDQYEVVTISIDPKETHELAAKKKATYIESLGKSAPGWHFLADKDDNSKTLAEQIGFHYRYDEQQQQFAHSAAIFILTPEGRVARYLYGARFRPMDVRFALAEASEGRTTMAVEKILLFCYHYDPKAGGYVLFASNVMRIGGLLTVFGILYFLWRMFKFERTRTARFKEGMA
jgi:protein SCO1